MKIAGYKALSLLCALYAGVALADLSQTVDFNIAPQTLQEALIKYSAQSGVQVTSPAEIIDGKSSAGVVGTYQARGALERLLQGTDLGFEIINENTVTIRQARQAADARKRSVFPGEALQLAQAEDAKDPATPAEAPQTTELGELEEIVVTGTHIRGSAPVGSPLTVYDREDIERSGVGTVEEFARQMPQNFTSIDAGALVGSSASGFDQKGSNFYRGAAFNLHGLGPGGTLTLLNGHRLTPGGDNGDFVDVSLIPLSAVERIEVLSGGASAIYGADAIAGVVNLILRKDFDGAETGLRYGDTTRGGGREMSVSQLLGQSWSSGNAMVVFEHAQQDPVRNAQRDFANPDFAGSMLLPEFDRNSVFANLRQEVRPGSTLLGEGFFSRRDTENLAALFAGPPPPILTSDDIAAKQYGGNLEFRQQLGGGWQASLVGGYSRIDQAALTVLPFAPGIELVQDANSSTMLVSEDLRADGSVFALPGGQARLAVGAGHRTESLNTLNVTDSTDLGGSVSRFSRDLERNVKSAYAELLLPLIGESNQKWAARRLDVSLAVRYDDYDDVGSSTNPKASLEWAPAAGIALRASYATSFRPALLTQLAEPAQQLYTTTLATNPDVPGDQIGTLIRQGAANSALQPEESKSWTAGISLQPQRVAGLSISADYFRTVFSDRIAFPPVTVPFPFDGLFTEFDVLAPFIDTSPDPQEIDAIFADPNNVIIDGFGIGANGVEAIFDFRPANIAETRESGIELNTGYTRSGSYGTLDFSLSGTYLLEVEYQPAKNSAVASLRNIVGEPVDLRLNGIVGWSRDRLGASLTLQYWDSYKNTFFVPSRRVNSWLTADLQLNYRIEQGSAAGILDGTSIALTVKNLADREPPALPFTVGSGSQIGYDAANASALGRSVSLALTKRW